MVSLRVTSGCFLRWCSCTMLGQHILQRYRRVRRGRLFGVWIRVWAPQNEPARRRRRLFLDATLPRSASMCYLKVNCLSSFTLREIGVELYDSVEPSSLTVVQFLSKYRSARSSAYMGQNFERCTIGHFQTFSTSITPGSPPVTQKPFLLVSS